MSTSLLPEWRVILGEDGDVLYHNDNTGEETKEAPYLSKLNKYKNIDLSIWQGRRDDCIDFAKVHPRPRINLDLNFGEKIGGRITVELFADVAPLACYNFYCMCTGELPDITGQPLKYKGTFFYKCLKDIGMFGGDIVNGDGTGDLTIYGAPFEFENTNNPIDRAGLLVCLNDGLHFRRNTSRFLITSAANPNLSGNVTLMGRVVRGLAVVRSAMNLVSDEEGHTTSTIVIANTTVTQDGPTPVNFVIPQKPSLRPNPQVPPVCISLMPSKTVVGLAHEYTKQAKAGETPAAEPVVNAAPATEGADNEDMVETAPGMEGQDLNDQAAAAAAAYNSNAGYYDYLQYQEPSYQQYQQYMQYQYTQPAASEEPEKAPGEEEEKEDEYIPMSFINNNMDDSRRGNMPRDNDGRALAHYLDLSTLDSHTGRKKSKKIPNGFKTWKEYGEFKKKEKRARQVKEILEDKYPVEYLEKHRHH